MAARMPWTKWFFPDWRKDAGVRSVSLAARGLWIEMLSLMDESPRRGFLLTASGKLMSAEQLARNAGCSIGETAALFRELEDAGVFSTSEDGIPYSRRMTRDDRIRKVRSEAGTKGGGNPNVCLNKTQTKRQQNRGDPPNKPSVLLNSSIQDSSKEGLILPFSSEDFMRAWEDWVDYRKVRKLATWKPVTIRARFVEFQEWGEAKSIVSIRQSILNCWNGLFEPKAKPAATASDGVDEWLKTRKEASS